MAAAVARTPSLDLVTCFSRDDEKRQAFALECGCEAAPSFEAAIEDPRVEAVLLVTPNFVHREQAVACAARGKHVFVEKPIADTLEDGRAMAEACEAAGSRCWSDTACAGSAPPGPPSGWCARARSGGSSSPRRTSRSPGP